MSFLRKIVSLIFLSWCILMVNPSYSSAKWDVVLTLPELHKAESLWFYDGVLLVFGHYIPQEIMRNHTLDTYEKMRSMESTILKFSSSSDAWEKVYSGNGNFLKVSSTSEARLFALGYQFTLENKKLPFLIESSDFGESWSQLPMPPAQFIGIDFSHVSIAYAWTEKIIYRSFDRGLSWEEMETEKQLSLSLNGPQPIVDKDGKVWVPATNEVIILGSGSTQSSELMGNNLQIEFMTIGDDNSLYFLCTKFLGKEKETLLLKRISEKEFRLIERFPYFLPVELLVRDNYIKIIVNDVVKTPPQYTLTFSNDAGKTWENEVPAISRKMKPVFFENAHVIWAGGSADRIQRRRKSNSDEPPFQHPNKRAVPSFLKIFK